MNKETVLDIDGASGEYVSKLAEKYPQKNFIVLDPHPNEPLILPLNVKIFAGGAVATTKCRLSTDR
ncbi:MAG TPA: hypothetical protein VGT05_03825 [Patescibacteria group bacterium]|nr:hypothetical protein [Patescibacteria group bacterium]